MTHLNENLAKMISNTEKTEILFNLYLTLKVIEDDSYEAFWKKHTSPRYAKL